MRTIVLCVGLVCGVSAQAADGNLLSAPAKTSYDQKNFDLCIQEMTVRIDARPGDEAALVERGWCRLLSAFGSAEYDRIRDRLAAETHEEDTAIDAAAGAAFDALRASAVDDATAAIASNPKSAAAYELRGMARAKIAHTARFTTQADLDAVIEDYDTAIRLAPNRVQSYRNRALEHLYNQSYVRALADLDRLKTLDPDDGAALEQRRPEAVAGAEAFQQDLQRCLAASNQYLCADVLEIHMADQPDSATAALQTARARASFPPSSSDERQASWSRAEPAYVRAIALDPTTFESYAELVDLYLTKLGEPSKALAVADKAVSAFPKRADARLLRAKTFLVPGDVPNARLDADRAIALAPDSSAAFCALGDVLSQQRDGAGARAAYDKAIALNAANGRAYLGRGILAGSEKDFAGALADLTEADALKQTCAKSYRGNVHVLMALTQNEPRDTGNFSKASGDFLTDDGVICYVTHYLHAQSLFAQGFQTEALERSQWALDRFRRSSEASLTEIRTVQSMIEQLKGGAGPTPSASPAGTAPQRLLEDYRARYAALGMTLVATGVYDYSVGIDPRMRVTIERVGFAMADTFVIVGVKEDGSHFGFDVMLDDRIMARPTGDGLSTTGDYGMSLDDVQEGTSAVAVAQVLLTARTSVRAMGFSPRGGTTSDVHWSIFHKQGE